MADKKITFDSSTVEFGRAVSIAKNIVREKSRFDIDTEGDVSRGSITINSSMNTVHLIELDGETEVSISGTDRFVKDFSSAMDAELTGSRNRGQNIGSEGRSGRDRTEPDRDEYSGAGEPQAHIDVMEDGEIKVKMDGSESTYMTLMGVFIDENANVAEAYSVDNIESIAGELEAKKAVDSFAEYVSEQTGIEKRRLM